MCDLRRHLPTCEDFKQEDTFSKHDVVYEPSRNVIHEFNDIFDTELDYKYEPLIVYDFEALVVPMKHEIGKKMMFLEV
jgi:hypothetical protein